MCYASLGRWAKSRTAVLGESLVLHKFPNSCMGFVSPRDSDPEKTLVCVTSGTALRIKAVPRWMEAFGLPQTQVGITATFVQDPNIAHYEQGFGDLLRYHVPEDAPLVDRDPIPLANHYPGIVMEVLEHDPSVTAEAPEDASEPVVAVPI